MNKNKKEKEMWTDIATYVKGLFPDIPLCPIYDMNKADRFLGRVCNVYTFILEKNLVEASEEEILTLYELEHSFNLNKLK